MMSLLAYVALQQLGQSPEAPEGWRLHHGARWSIYIQTGLKSAAGSCKPTKCVWKTSAAYLMHSSSSWASKLRAYLVLQGFAAHFMLLVGEDDALFVHGVLLLPALFKHLDLQATSQNNGSVACNTNTRVLTSCTCVTCVCRQSRNVCLRLRGGRGNIQYLR